MTNEFIVYVPLGADKGDCPYCFNGVLYRDSEFEEIYGIEELYTCDRCNTHFTEDYSYGRRNFSKIDLGEVIPNLKKKG